MTVQWLSFAGDEGFRGVVLVNADDFLQAVLLAIAAGVSPGGEVAGFEITDELQRDAVEAGAEQALATLKMPRLKLLTQADFDAAGVQLEGMGE